MNKVVLGYVRGDKGDQGPQGLQGVQGLPGTRGSRWVCGTAISGIFTEPKVCSETGITDALVNDQYMNPYEGNIYRCCVAGDADTATWVWTGQMDNGRHYNQIVGNSAEWASASDTWNYIHAVTRVTSLSGGHYYVAVGEDGTVLQSTDGINWTSDWSGTSNLYGVAAGDNGVIVAVGGEVDDGDKTNITDGVILHSQGLGWQNIVSMSTLSNLYTLRSVVYGNGKFVAVGGFKNTVNGVIIYSENGIDWKNSVHKTDSGTDTNFNHYHQIKFYNNKFVAVGYSGAYAYSTDGINWTEGYNESIDEDLYSVAYHNGTYVAAGANNTIVYSENGQDWSLVDLSLLELSEYRNASCATFIDNKFIVFFEESRDVLVSEDGKNWSESDSIIDDHTVRDIYQGPEKCLAAVGDTVYHTDTVIETRSIEDAINEIYAFLGIRQ